MENYFCVALQYSFTQKKQVYYRTHRDAISESLKDREYYSSRNEFGNDEFYDEKKLQKECDNEQRWIHQYNPNPFIRLFQNCDTTSDMLAN